MASIAWKKSYITFHVGAMKRADGTPEWGGVEKVEDLLKRPKLTQVPISWGNGSSLIQ